MIAEAFRRKRLVGALSCGIVAALLGAATAAQDGSLLYSVPPPAPPAASQGPLSPATNAGLTLANSSFIHQPLPPEAEYRELRKEDIITVLVD
ncbi:MAG: hypothetical protein AAF589_05565, partial [Planctomycetota bacterium]